MNAILCMLVCLAPGQIRQPAPMGEKLGMGIYRAFLKSPGGELPFILQLDEADGKQKAWIINGSQKIEVPSAVRTKNHFRLDINHYDATIDLDVAFSSSQLMAGIWKKRSGPNEFVQMDVVVEVNSGWLFRPILKMTEEVTNYGPIAGRWSMQFEKSGESAIAVFKQGTNRSVEGTILTPSGDYGYLAGSFEHGELRLSSFDGAHAFLFTARMLPEGSLKGEFFSGTKWREGWSARRDEKAVLPDGFGTTKPNPNAHLKDLTFADVDGKQRSFGDAGMLGKATIVEVFGTWCPNCHDAADLLVELEKKYGGRGLKVVGMAFELTNDAERSAKQVKAYQARHNATYPVLLGGAKDKSVVPRVFPVIDGMKGYPTFLFVDSKGEIQKIYTGFSGPATGEEYVQLRQSFERVIEELLGPGH